MRHDLFRKRDAQPRVRDLILLTSAETVSWTMADNSTETLTSPDIDAVLAEVTRYRTDVHAAFRPLGLAIYSEHASIGDVEAIDVSGFVWPSSEHADEENTGDHAEDG